jgi:hypothetical protein
VTEIQDQRTGRPCEDCGTELVVGPLPTEVALEGPHVAASGEPEYADWCPNLGCLSNHVLPGLARIGVRRYVCTVCQLELSGPTSQIFAHRREPH